MSYVRVVCVTEKKERSRQWCDEASSTSTDSLAVRARSIVVAVVVRKMGEQF